MSPEKSPAVKVTFCSRISVSPYLLVWEAYFLEMDLKIPEDKVWAPETNHDV